jgi:hypothetical protein
VPKQQGTTAVENVAGRVAIAWCSGSTMRFPNTRDRRPNEVFAVGFFSKKAEPGRVAPRHGQYGLSQKLKDIGPGVGQRFGERNESATLILIVCRACGAKEKFLRAKDRFEGNSSVARGSVVRSGRIRQFPSHGPL